MNKLAVQRYSSQGVRSQNQGGMRPGKGNHREVYARSGRGDGKGKIPENTKG
jgi:hypothetical protein